MAGKYYFLSDFHLGAPNKAASLEREKKIIAFLNEIEDDIAELFILGDVFDFWFEYKHAAPRGHIRLLGKLAALSDRGIPIHWFTGNHDMWIFDYLPDELQIQLHRAPIRRTLLGKTFYIGHGDGLGPGDHGYKLLKKVFSSKVSQWLFGVLHPNVGIGMANYFSSSSRKANREKDAVFLGKEQEWLAQYCEEIDAEQPTDFYLFGHRHLPMVINLERGGQYINTGDWITHFTYAVFDESGMELRSFEGQPTIYGDGAMPRTKKA